MVCGFGIGVFTELIKQVGVKGIQVDELMTLEDEELNQIKYESTMPLISLLLDRYMA